MGFINSASTTTLSLKLTDAGRKHILNGGNVMSMFNKFGISDGDIDYNNTQKHSDTSATVNDSDLLGFLPDITGDETTFRNSVNAGYYCNNNVWVKPEATNVVKVPKKFASIGIKGVDGVTRYYRDTVEIDVYLHDYFVLNKLLMSRYIAEHNKPLSKSGDTIVDSVNSYFSTTLGVTTNGEYGAFLDKLSAYGIGQYMDFWSDIKVYDGSTLKSENMIIESGKDCDYYNTIALAGGAYITNNGRGEQNGIDYTGTNLRGVKVASPFSMIFSPGIGDEGKVYKSGAGNASIGFGAFDMGYLNVGGLGKWDTGDEPYPNFIMNNTKNGWSGEVDDIKNVFVGFVSAVDMETSSVIFAGEQYDNITTTIPTSRIVLNVGSSKISPKYYPIKLKQLSRTREELLDMGDHVDGIQITDTNRPSDTFGLLCGQLEYISDWNNNQIGFLSSAPYFSIVPGKLGDSSISATKVGNFTDPFYTLGTRMMGMAEDIFLTIASKNNNYWDTTDYTGGFYSGLSGETINDYNINIPINWTIRSRETPNASPVNVKVNFRFNKRAITESLPYSAASSQSYYRPYDDNTFKFYGEDGVTLASHTTDPRGHNYVTNDTYSWRTSNNKQIFRKLISGQEIKTR
tara:strand:- start:1503 stop:3386 length:1884 start_codon:yes stop_codon:yes gene_type:complete